MKFYAIDDLQLGRVTLNSECEGMILLDAFVNNFQSLDISRGIKMQQIDRLIYFIGYNQSCQIDNNNDKIMQFTGANNDK